MGETKGRVNEQYPKDFQPTTSDGEFEVVKRRVVYGGPYQCDCAYVKAMSNCTTCKSKYVTRLIALACQRQRERSVTAIGKLWPDARGLVSKAAIAILREGEEIDDSSDEENPQTRGDA